MIKNCLGNIFYFGYTSIMRGGGLCDCGHVYETRGPIVLLRLGTKYIRMRKTLHKFYCQKARNADSLPVEHCFHISLSASVYHKRNQRTTEKS